MRKLTLFFLKETNPVARRASGAREAASSSELGSQPTPADAKGGRARRPTGPASIWSNPVARYLLIQWGFHTLSFMTYMSCISLFAYLRLGLDAGQVGRLLMIAGIVRVFIRFVIFVPLLERLGDRKTSRVGLTAFVLVFFLLGLVRNQLQFTLALCAVSFAASCTRSILNSFLSRSVKPTEQGQAMGLSASLDSFAHIVGPLVGGFILGSLPLWMYGGLAGAFALGALLMAFKRIEFPHERRAEAASKLE